MSRPRNYTQPGQPPEGASPSDDEGSEVIRWEGHLHRSRIHQVTAIYGSLVAALLVVWVVIFTLTEPHRPPDLSHYVHLKTISGEELDLDGPKRRLIMVGDLHGMLPSLNSLLDKLVYDPEHDLLVHLGDVTSKGPHSNELLSIFARDNILGVRGNNDQKVLEWYSYFEWVKSQGAGKWLEHLIKENISASEWKKLGLGPRLKFPIPEDWEWGSDHWTVARNMNQSDYDYLRSLPIVLHFPSMHTLLVHAGILPIDPSRSIYNRHQPLTHLPKYPKLLRDWSNAPAVRNAQELSLLTKIEGNTDPYVKLNIRDVHDGVPMRRGPDDHEDTTPWSDLWNNVIKRCGGFNVTTGLEEKPDKYLLRFQRTQSDPTKSDNMEKRALPCYPITVVYSHASSRGLDLKKWSKGLDTGCVNGNGLTAMVLGKGRHLPLPPIEDDPDPNDHDRDIEVRFGEDRHARLVSVPCPKGTTDE